MPLVTVMFLRLQVTPLLTENTRTVLPPLTVILSAPPSMVRFLSIVSWALVSVMVCPARLASKVIVPSAHASAIAWRSEPAPLSALLVTVMLEAHPTVVEVVVGSMLVVVVVGATDVVDVVVAMLVVVVVGTMLVVVELVVGMVVGIVVGMVLGGKHNPVQLGSVMQAGQSQILIA